MAPRFGGPRWPVRVPGSGEHAGWVKSTVRATRRRGTHRCRRHVAHCAYAGCERNVNPRESRDAIPAPDSVRDAQGAAAPSAPPSPLALFFPDATATAERRATDGARHASSRGGTLHGAALRAVASDPSLSPAAARRRPLRLARPWRHRPPRSPFWSSASARPRRTSTSAGTGVTAHTSYGGAPRWTRCASRGPSCTRQGAVVCAHRSAPSHPAARPSGPKILKLVAVLGTGCHRVTVLALRRLRVPRHRST